MGDLIWGLIGGWMFWKGRPSSPPPGRFPGTVRSLQFYMGREGFFSHDSPHFVDVG